MIKKYLITINNQDYSIRLDRYLTLHYPHLTQGVIQKALRKKNITINSKKGFSDLRLKNNDKISIDEFLISNNHLVIKNKKVDNQTITLSKKILSHFLIYQDNNLLVINKPAKLATQGGSRIKFCIDSALQYLNEKSSYDLHLVHRLDMETSGILLIAKNHSSAIKLTQAFKEKKINKIYLAIINFTTCINNQGEITSIIDNKESITKYKILKYYRNNIALVQLNPITGRTHQLRQHMVQIGTNILGDKKYFNQKHKINSKYLMLHAYMINISKSILDKELNLIAKLPNYFNDYLI